jgi:hypothetical protein
MNNTRNLLLITIIAATLVMGTSVIPMQSYAGGQEDHKKAKDLSSITSNYESDKKIASQDQDQGNFCYRGDDCEQANQGQQVIGKDNEANGFNDQSRNIQQQALTPTSTPTQPPTPIPTLTCVECFTTAFEGEGLTNSNILSIIAFLIGSGESIESLCDGQTFTVIGITNALTPFDIPQAKITALIDCLRAAGITVTGTTV